MKINGWGRYPSVDADIFLPQNFADIAQFMQTSATCIPRGLGRSYGDSANHSTVIQSSYLDHYLAFDRITGILTCEAGVSIRTILDMVVPLGWFLPVTSGTSYVTMGGAIASDIHGKNHHSSGTFSEHVLSFDLMLASGEMVTVSRQHLPELFQATCGGMGLTGMILSVTLQLKSIGSGYILQDTYRFSSLEEVCEQFEMNQAATYSVAWIDCLAKGSQLGRSLLMLGEHDTNQEFPLPKKKVLNIPMDIATGILNSYSIKAFNFLYYNKSRLQKPHSRLPYTSYFYPLDAISNWNRLYGKNGFVQYQFVIPKESGVTNLRKILTQIVASGKGSFLAVLKKFGKANTNYLSFPMEGFTLALDFQMSLSTLELVKKLDEMIVAMGGKIYLTKDALMSETTFKMTYPAWETFQEVRSRYGAIGKFSSQQSRRLGLN